MKKLLIFIFAIFLSLNAFAYSTTSIGKSYIKSLDSSEHMSATEVSFVTYKSIDFVKTDIGVGIVNIFSNNDDMYRVSPIVTLLWNIKKYTLSIEGYTPYDIKCNDYG